MRLEFGNDTGSLEEETCLLSTVSYFNMTKQRKSYNIEETMFEIKGGYQNDEFRNKRIFRFRKQWKQN